MNWVGCGAPLLVVGVAALRRKLLVLDAVDVGERAGDDVPVLELHRIGERLEQPPPDDFEPFLGAGWPPGRLDAADDVPQSVERLPEALAANLHVVRPGVRGAGGIRGRQTDHEQAVAGQLRRFRQYLRKRELRLEAARRQVALVVKLARIGDPFVSQYQAGSVRDAGRSAPSFRPRAGMYLT